MADIAQLVSFVRNERARLAGFAMLDDVLTVVQDAELLVEAAAKQVKEYEAKLEGLKATLTQTDAEQATKCEQLVTRLAAYQADHEATLNRATDKALGEQASLKASVELMEQNYAVALNDFEGTRKAVANLTKQREDLESDIASLHKQLQDIKDSIK